MNENILRFRDASIEDLSRIVEIYNSTVPGRMVTADTEPVSIESKYDWFIKHHTTRPLWMVEEGDSIIGWVSFQDFYGRPAYNGTAEVSIYIDESFRSKGYGNKILKYCIEKAASLEITTLLGFIFSHNLPSIRLFLHHGFEEWGNLKDVAVIDEKKYSVSIFGRKIVDT